MIDVKKLVEERKNLIKESVSNYLPKTVKLSVIQVGNNPASNAYIKGKMKDCAEVGVIGDLHKLDEHIDPNEVLKLITQLNKDEECHGIILQLPLPEQFTSKWKDVLFKSIAWEKDVDGFRKESGFIPCTPMGIMTILNHVKEQKGIKSFNGMTACVIGRSDLVGKPMVNLLIESGCTVVSCNSHTVDIDKWIDSCDIIVCAVGKANFLSLKNKVNWANKIVIDVGINRNEEGKLCGDCSHELYDCVEYITPVPGGVGLTTRLSLLENTIKFI